jgi:hypothetical protein
MGAHQTLESARIPGVTAHDPVMTERPQISRLADRLCVEPLRIDAIGRIRGVLLEVGCDLINLNCGEACNRDVETFLDQDF